MEGEEVDAPAKSMGSLVVVMLVSCLRALGYGWCLGLRMGNEMELNVGMLICFCTQHPLGVC